MTDQETITEYSKIHNRDETIQHFHNGSGADEISMGLSLHLKAIGQIWDTAQSQTIPKVDNSAKVEICPEITLTMREQDGKAVFEYHGPDKSGKIVTQTGQIKNRAYAVKLAKGAVKNSHANEIGLNFIHGIEQEMDQFLRAQFSNLCLSQDVYADVEKEIFEAYKPPMYQM